MKARVLPFAALALAAVAVAAREEVSTVGTVAESNGLTKDGWLRVKTPSILGPVQKSEPVEPDLQKALVHYDRLLELEAEPGLRAEGLRRAAALRLRMAERGDDIDESSLRQAAAIYERLLAELPDEPSQDRTLYQLARVRQLLGDGEEAIGALQRLGEKFPDSPLAADADFRVGELLYQRGRYAAAEAHYAAVVARPADLDNPYFEPAQYKLGWSLYKQSRYEDALPVFIAILERELPAGALADPAAVKAAKSAELARDALRATSLSFAALGGGTAINGFFARQPEPRFGALLYAAAGELLLDKRRYSDAAAVYAAFIERHPRHALAPQFQARAIAAFEAGGFSAQVIAAKETYVGAYAGAPDARRHLDDLGRHYHAAAQRLPEPDAGRRAAFLAAARWHRRTLELFPEDERAPEINLLYADALYDAGETAEAGRQYLRTAYDYPAHAKSAEAAYAAVQAHDRLLREAAPEARAAALQLFAAAGVKFADAFPDHAEAATVLARAGHVLFERKEYEPAIALAQRALQKAPPEARRQALAVIADARYAQQQYPEAERAYAELLNSLPSGERRRAALEQMAASIYRQGEAARDAGDARAAAQQFQRVGVLAPESSIRTTADYDAAAAYIAAQDWRAAAAALETFRARNPLPALAADADKKLAHVYEKDGRLAAAGAAYARIAQREVESPELRREAAWRAAELFDQARAGAAALQAYDFYLQRFPQPLERAQRARRRLADLARDERGDRARYAQLLREIVAADRAAGTRGDEASRTMAAQASLELGRLEAAAARAVALRLPVDKSLPVRKAATESAIALFAQAASYGYADIVTAATYELGMVYRDLGRALLDSERPGKLAREELEQYNVLLEEQAFPFEEKAIAAHEANLARLRQGVWDEWIRRSTVALAELSPGKYGKREQREASYDTPH